MTSQSLSRSRTSSDMNKFIIFEFLDLKYGEIDTKIESVAFVLDEIRQGHRNPDVTVTCHIKREWDVISFLIFEFLNLQYGKIGIKIEFVAFVLEEIRQGHGNRDFSVTF